ncbi:MAG: phosphoglucosamine mutase [Legionellaceae bacterium]|nr:phosphoglucosamine mutase [Legionellaceae bacterium]
MSRRYFGTDGIRGRVGEQLVNPEFMMKLGWAVGRVLANGERKKVVIGKDTRVSGYMLESALEAGLSAAGVDVRLLGPMPTPAIAYLTQTLRANAGIVISASHNPFEDNGIKFFTAEGTKLPDELELAIEQEIDKPLRCVSSANLGKAARVEDAAGRYIEFCKSTIPSLSRLTGLKIVVDCANGATYHIAPNVFSELGAEVISMADKPDGFNINQRCGSTAPELLCQKVLSSQADVGIALDGDGDRVIMVDKRGHVINGDELLYIIARDRQHKGLLCGGVVGTVMSNYGLELAFKEQGIGFLRSKVGDRYVLESLIEKGWKIGGEPSGHVVCLDKTTTGDGIVAALQVLSAMLKQAKSLDELLADLYLFPQELVNIKTDNAAALLNHPKVLELVTAAEKKLKRRGRVLLRPSGTEALLRVMVEAEDAQMVHNMAVSLTENIGDIDAEIRRSLPTSITSS